MMILNNQKYYTVADVAELIGFGEATVRAKIRKGIILSEKIGKSYFITEEDLRDYINRRRNEIAKKRSIRQGTSSTD